MCHKDGSDPQVQNVDTDIQTPNFPKNRASKPKCHSTASLQTPSNDVKQF